MASAGDIQLVRYNVNELTQVPYTDAAIGALVDQWDVIGATIIIWEQKASTYAGLTNVTEAGASHSFGDLHKNALNLLAYWRKRQLEVEAPVNDGRVQVKKIVRT